MVLLYRAMIEENGFPKIGRSPRMLGIRLSIDVDVEQVPEDWLDEQGCLRPSVEQSNSPTVVEVAIRNHKEILIMAWSFSLSAECGSCQSDAEQLAKYFNQIYWQLPNGVESKCNTGVFQDSEDNWWTRVCPSGISQVGITTPEDAYQMTEIGILLYQHLQYAPAFRYALVGLEVDEFRTYSELISENNHDNQNFSGLVLSETLWQQMNYLVGFRVFAAGYFWKPYEGEVYKPLLGSSDLREKFNELFAIQA